jgi:hypothetical protein
MADRSVCGSAAQAGWAAAAPAAAEVMSAAEPMPVRPSSWPVAGSVTAAVPPAAAVQPPLYTLPRHVASSRNATECSLIAARAAHETLFA